jgi:hypothetical protein
MATIRENSRASPAVARSGKFLHIATGNLIWRARFSPTLKKGHFVEFSRVGFVLPRDATLFSFR